MSVHDPDREDATVYKVVVNHEEQYSIWPEYREMPPGWRAAGKSGSKSACLTHIKEVWTDMRPLSLRRQMEEGSLRRGQETPRHSDARRSPERKKESLVTRLSEGRHPVESCLRPERTAQALKDQISLGYVRIKFPETQGGTELGVRVDPYALDLSRADFENQNGTVHLEGELTLDLVRVRCIADIDLQTLSGQGHVVPV
jgi:uncharacterized protein YbdZ (MbtH family)